MTDEALFSMAHKLGKTGWLVSHKAYRDEARVDTHESHPTTLARKWLLGNLKSDRKASTKLGSPAAERKASSFEWRELANYPLLTTRNRGKPMTLIWHM